MKFLILFFALTSCCFAAQDSAIVRFANGEQLSGNAVALNLQTLTWQSELLKENANFKLDQIKDLELPSKLDLQSVKEASHEAVLQLSNGDTVKGQLTGLNEKEIHLKTWYAGDLVFRRINVKAITISRASKVIYSGPAGLDDWKMIGENSWEFANNEFVSKTDGGIARDFDFTDDVQISYDLSWKGMLKSKVIFFSSDLTTTQPQSGYELTFQGSLVGLRRLSDNSRLRVTSYPRRSIPNEKVRINLRISRNSNQIMLFMNDSLHSTWKDEDMEDTKGKGLIFDSDNDYTLKLSNILISEWDGHVDEEIADEDDFGNPGFNGDPRFNNLHFRRQMPAEPVKPKELPEGRMLLANGDTLEGVVLGVENEIIKVKTPYTDVKFPIHRIRNIALNKTADLETPRKHKGDVRALLADGSTLVFRLDNVKDGKLIGFSQNFGSAEFLQSAFQRIEFNYHFRDK